MHTTVITAHRQTIPGAKLVGAVRRAKLADTCDAAAVAVKQQR